MMHGVDRLHWGCGSTRPAGWVNADRQSGAGIDISCDIRDGLPIDDDTFDYAVSVHALQEVPLDELVAVLRELRRVLRSGGVLRLVLPDARKAIDAYLAGNADHFLVPDEDARSLGGKFVTHILWYGHSRTMFTTDFIVELLEDAGYSRVEVCGFNQTASAYSGIVELDNRPEESLYVEAVK